MLLVLVLTVTLAVLTIIIFAVTWVFQKEVAQWLEEVFRQHKRLLRILGLGLFLIVLIVLSVWLESKVMNMLNSTTSDVEFVVVTATSIASEEVTNSEPEINLEIENSGLSDTSVGIAGSDNNVVNGDVENLTIIGDRHVATAISEEINEIPQLEPNPTESPTRTDSPIPTETVIPSTVTNGTDPPNEPPPIASLGVPAQLSINTQTSQTRCIVRSIANGNINIRQESFVGSPVLGTISVGTMFFVTLHNTDGWLKAEANQTDVVISGWIDGSLVVEIENNCLSSIPIIPAPTPTYPPRADTRQPLSTPVVQGNDGESNSSDSGDSGNNTSAQIEQPVDQSPAEEVPQPAQSGNDEDQGSCSGKSCKPLPDTSNGCNGVSNPHCGNDD